VTEQTEAKLSAVALITLSISDANRQYHEQHADVTSLMENRRFGKHILISILYEQLRPI
jgi:hypothetical protein